MDSPLQPCLKEPFWHHLPLSLYRTFPITPSISRFCVLLILSYLPGIIFFPCLAKFHLSYKVRLKYHPIYEVVAGPPRENAPLAEQLSRLTRNVHHSFQPRRNLWQKPSITHLSMPGIKNTDV